MQDWNKYIERPIVEVLPELEAKRAIRLEKYQEDNIAPEDADWWVEDVFEDGESYQESI